MPDIAHQYRIIVSSAGARSKADRGRLRFTGADRVAFLQALVTNDLIALKPHQGIYAAYLTPQGRMVTDLRIFVRPDAVVADVPATIAASLVERFDALVFAEDVQVADASTALAQIAVLGGRAAAVIGASTGADAAALASLPVWSQIDFNGGFIVRTDDAEIESYDIIVDVLRATEVMAGLESAGAVHMSADLAEAIRVSAGHPRFGTDMTADTIPLEAGLLERAISTSKGCYVGQEIVIRVLHRGGGRVAKRLVKLALRTSTGADELPAPGSVLVVDGKDVGSITSVVPSLDGEGITALAYVHRDHAETGRTVSVAGLPGTSATIAAFAG